MHEGTWSPFKVQWQQLEFVFHEYQVYQILIFKEFDKFIERNDKTDPKILKNSE